MLGIRTELVIQPYADHRESLGNGDHDLAVFGWIGDTGDPDNFLYVLFHSDNAAAGVTAQNFAFYRQPIVDQLLIEAQGAIDGPTRSALYQAVQDQLAVDEPWVPLAHSEYIVAVRAELRDVVLSPQGHPIYAAIWRRPEPSR
jgi:peptide/nickel transport system substrate-binding protein